MRGTIVPKYLTQTGRKNGRFSILQQNERERSKGGTTILRAYQQYACSVNTSQYRCLARGTIVPNRTQTKLAITNAQVHIMTPNPAIATQLKFSNFEN